VILLIAAVLIFVYYQSLANNSLQQVPSTKKIATIIATQQIGKDKPVTINIVSGKTALDLLQQTAKVQTTGQGTNAFVTQINNVKTDSSKKQYWAFYVNGKLSAVGAGSYKLNSGDKIEWKLENY